MTFDVTPIRSAVSNAAEHAHAPSQAAIPKPPCAHMAPAAARLNTPVELNRDSSAGAESCLPGSAEGFRASTGAPRLHAPMPTTADRSCVRSEEGDGPAGAATPPAGPQREREDRLDADIAAYTERTLCAMRDGRIRAAREAQDQARKLIASRSAAHVARLEREKGLR